MMEVFLLRQCLLLPPVLQHCSRAWLVFKSLLTNPGASALCQTPKRGLQREKKQNNRALEAKPKEVPVPKSGNIVCMCILHAREEKGGSISCRREENWGGAGVQGGGGEAKRNPSLQTPEVWLGEAATERNALLLLLHGNYSRQKESRPICC